MISQRNSPFISQKNFESLINNKFLQLMKKICGVEICL